MATSQLKTLNTRSAPVNKFDVAIFHPVLHEYTYEDKRSGTTKHGKAFRCLLVSTDDRTQYVAAILAMRGTNVNPLNDAKVKFKENHRFRMGKTRLKTEVQQQYIHSPVKVVVDISGSRFDPLEGSVNGDAEQLAAEPPMTVADCVGLAQSQQFDVTALVEDVSPVREVNDTRVVRDVILVDGSKIKEKLQQLKLSFYYARDTSPKDLECLKMLHNAAGTTTPLSFFGIQGKKNSQGFKFEPSREFFITPAPTTIGKGAQLISDAEALRATPQEERETLETTFSPGSKDYTPELGIETNSALLRSMSNSSNVKAIDENPTVWQLNWVEVAWPAGSTVCRNDGQALWFNTTIVDIHGSKDDVWMDQQSALTLSNLPDKQAFIDAWEAGDQTFPIMASVKVVRTMDQLGGASQPANAEAKRSAKFVIVQAVMQPFDEPPTKASLDLTNYRKDVSDDTSRILPAPLHMIKESPCYALQVVGDLFTLPCQRVVALIVSSEKSKPETVGTDGYRLVTKNVECAMADDDPHLAAKYTLMATCTIDNLAAYRLDPVRGQKQHAMVTITSKLDDALVVDQVQLLSQESAMQAKASFNKLVILARRTNERDRKREVTWTEESSPASAKKCRVLGRSATDNPLDQP